MTDFCRNFNPIFQIMLDLEVALIQASNADHPIIILLIIFNKFLHMLLIFRGQCEGTMDTQGHMEGVSGVSGNPL